MQKRSVIGLGVGLLMGERHFAQTRTATRLDPFDPAAHDDHDHNDDRYHYKYTVSGPTADPYIAAAGPYPDLTPPAARLPAVEAGYAGCAVR